MRGPGPWTGWSAGVAAREVHGPAAARRAPPRVQARAPRARMRPATRAGSGAGRGGAARSPRAHGSTTAQRTWERRGAEDIGAPRAREHRTPPQQRHRGSNGRASWWPRREYRPSTAPELCRARGPPGRRAPDARRSAGTADADGPERRARAPTRLEPCEHEPASSTHRPARPGRGAAESTGGAGGGGARPAETRHERLCTSACGASGWTPPAGTVGCRAAVRVLAACRRVSRGTRGGVGG